ncbi:MAG: hypothetical protein AAGE59_21450 [Cyanobacteria bacterium P01_F01_bin.86]
MSKINFQINPKAYYAAIAYSYLAGLNPQQFIQEEGQIGFAWDRNDTPESQHIEDFLSRDTRRTMSALQALNSSLFPTHASFVDALEKRLKCEKNVAELAPLLEEILYH